ncbi:MAG: cobalamin biosynthesis protein CbiM [Bacteroides sp.]|nr:cobalamin biosynthesis protein CbiM [Bacteroides sp.]
MHMADALVSTPVALTAGVAAASLLGIAGYKVNREKNVNSKIIPLMGVLGAFIFAAQMINFTIPGTGSSGHIIGGILLAAFLGPWAAFLTLSSVLIIQCLIFADGGLLALGCNIINMAAMSTLVAYPLIFRPIAGQGSSAGRLIAASLLACLVGIELGACAVTLETELSGITALPTSYFLALMTGIHLAIGIGEGLATAAILVFVAKSRPDLLATSGQFGSLSNKNLKKLLWGFGIAAVLLGGGLAFFASEYPDGLEWSIQKITGSTELESSSSSIAGSLEKVQSATSIMPDYDNNLAGIIGAAMVVILVWAVTSLLLRNRGRKEEMNENKQ